MDVNTNQMSVDQYTSLHFAAGIVMRSLGMSFFAVVLASLVWEYAIEPEWKRSDPGFFPAPSQDRPINSFFDTVAVVGGWIAAPHFLGKEYRCSNTRSR